MPRTPDRIPVVLEALRAFWERHPDLRLGQMILAAAKTGEHAPKLFQLEDDELLRRFAELDQKL